MSPLQTKANLKYWIAYYKKHAKKQEDNGQFDTVFHDNVKKLNKELKKLKGKKEVIDIQAELRTPEYGDK